MARAMWRGKVIAESETFEVVEGNVYFPADRVDAQHVRASETHTRCPWKGVASYYDVVVDGQVNRDAAWYYPETSAEAARIRGHVAFWRGVEVTR